MLIISQNKEKVMRFGISFNALKYAERTDRKGKQTIVRHTICISDGLLEEVAEYESKERCIPHTHHGYLHNENDGAKGAANLTPKEKRMVESVTDKWYNRRGK